MTMTQEEQDALILKELNISDGDTTINEEESTEEEDTEDTQEYTQEEEETTEETESESEEDAQEDEEEEESEEQEERPKNKFAKLLAKKNEAKKEAEQARQEKEEAMTQVQELQAKLDQLNEDGDYGNEEYVNTMVEKKIAEREAVSDFFEEYTDVSKYKKDIISFRKGTSFSIEEATKYYLADNHPELLLTPQARAKQKAKMFDTPSKTSKKIQTGKKDYSDSEFEQMVAKGLITL